MLSDWQGLAGPGWAGNIFRVERQLENYLHFSPRDPPGIKTVGKCSRKIIIQYFYSKGIFGALVLPQVVKVTLVVKVVHVYSLSVCSCTKFVEKYVILESILGFERPRKPPKTNPGEGPKTDPENGRKTFDFEFHSKVRLASARGSRSP